MDWKDLNCRFYLLSLICFLVVTSDLDDTTGAPRIGIIGGGIGGTSTAYFLRELFGDGAVIDIFEQSSVGGRLATVNIEGKEYEAGGSIIHPSNMYMVNFTSLLGLEKRVTPPGETLGIYDGTQLVLKTSPYAAITLAKLFWRYGMDIYNIRKFVSDKVLNKFKRIYEIQENGFAYTSVTDLLRSMDPTFVNYLQKSIAQVLREEGFGETFIKEMVRGAMRTNYGQTEDVPGFVGAVSMAGIEGNLWSVKGGNKCIPQGLVNKGKAHLIQGSVKTVELLEHEDALYEVYYTLGKEGQGKKTAESRRYDMLVVATPMHDGVSNINFDSFPKDIVNFPQKFHQTIATFVLGKPNASFYGLPEDESIPSSVFTSNPYLFMNSYGRHVPVDYSGESPENTQFASKVFSNKPPSKEEMEKYFETIQDIRIIPWLAYPEYDFKTEDLPPFMLYDKLYYVNAIELAASAMEMSTIAAKNIALLAYHHWHDNLDRIDEPYQSDTETQKSEL